MTEFTYKPKGVCSQSIEISLDDEERIADITFTGGCHGNLQGLAALVRGRDARDVQNSLRGICCGYKTTSCPDQLAVALGLALGQDGNDSGEV